MFHVYVATNGNDVFKACPDSPFSCLATIVTLLFLRDMGKVSGELQPKRVEQDSPLSTDDKAFSSTPDVTADHATLEGGTRERNKGS